MCMECRQTPCHPRCPNSLEPKFEYYCYDCGEGIYVDDEYVENEHGEKIHYDCAHNMTVRELMTWLGYEIKRMKDYD